MKCIKCNHGMDFYDSKDLKIADLYVCKNCGYGFVKL